MAQAGPRTSREEAIAVARTLPPDAPAGPDGDFTRTVPQCVPAGLDGDVTRTVPPCVPAGPDTGVTL